MSIIPISCSGHTDISPLDLKPFQGGLKDLSVTNYKKLKAGILKLGFSEPLSIWLYHDTNYVLNGHQRLRTILKMIDEGYSCDTLPCNIVQAKNKKQAKEKILALTSQYGEITSSGLYEFLNDAELSIDDVNEFYRFADIDTEKFIEEFGSKIDLPDDPNVTDNVPDTLENEHNVQHGDIWVLGNHRLMCGDSTNEDTVLKLLDGVRPELCFTDPPYNVGFDYKSHNDNMSEPDYQAWCKEWFDILLKNTDRIIITPGTVNLFLWAHINKPKTVAIWLKMNACDNGSISHLRKHEPILFWGKGYKKRPTDLFDCPVTFEKVDHPCSKTVGLITELLDVGCKETVLDIFAGSGSTIIAAEKTGRSCLSLEIDTHYCSVIIKRWQGYTGKQAYKI